MAQQRWLWKLTGYDFIVEYKRGGENVVAYALSRRCDNDPFLGYTLFAFSQLIPHWLDAIQEETITDPNLQVLRTRIFQGGVVGPWKEIDGVILYKDRIFIASNSDLVQDVIKEFHGSTYEGYVKTFQRIKATFYWKGMRKQIKEFIRRCDVCQRHKMEKLIPTSLLQPLPIPAQIWEDISMDFVDGLPSSSGKSTILIVVDRLSKYSHFIPLSHPYTAVSVARMFFDRIFKLHGRPKSISCDRGPNFTCAFWKELFHLNGTSFNFSSSYHPQTDGQSEVFNRTLEKYLHCFTSSNPKEWLKWLTWAEYCYNTSWHSTIQRTPFEVVYGRLPPQLLNYVPGTAKLEADERELLSCDQVSKEV